MSKSEDVVVDKGHSYVIIGYSNDYTGWPDSKKFESNVNSINPKDYLGNGGQGDPGKGGLGQAKIAALKRIAAASLAADNSRAIAKTSTQKSKAIGAINIDAPFKFGRAEIKSYVDERYYGAIELPTLGAAREWLGSKVGKDFLKAYDVVFIQATMGCSFKDEDGL